MGVKVHRLEDKPRGLRQSVPVPFDMRAALLGGWLVTLVCSDVGTDPVVPIFRRSGAVGRDSQPNGHYRRRGARHAYTVVGGAANARSFRSIGRTRSLHPVGDETSLAVLSARPDGPRLDLLSVLCAMSPLAAQHVVVAMKDLVDVTPRPVGDGGTLVAAISVREPRDGRAAPTSLACAWMGAEPVFNATIFRLVCQSDGWKAMEAMRAHRLRMTLEMTTPAFEAALDFTTESIAQLPEPARASVCLDLQYFEFIPARDFDEWAIAQQLSGIERVYVPDQLMYRRQAAAQFGSGLALPSHDFAHRYVAAGARASSTRSTYHMKVLSDGGSNYLCLHEHWYDEWIGVAWTPDEYLVLSSHPVPQAPTPLVSEAIRSELAHQLAPGSWPFCKPELCVIRPFYGPTEVAKGDSTDWTLPNDGMQAQLGTASALATERYIRRYAALPPRGSILKCFVHSDWRLSIMHIKLHGSRIKACPPHLPCRSAQGPLVLRTLCLAFCGRWGNKSCPNCSSPAQSGGCGHANAAAMRILATKFELAHFRIPPPENRRKGFRVSEWLPALGGVVRRHLNNISV